MDKTSKKTLMERTTNLAMTISAPLAKLAEKPSIAAIQNGMVSIVPIITIGSIFMILFVLGSPSVGNAEHGLLPFLEPYAMKFLWVNNMTMRYAQKLGREIIVIALITRAVSSR